MFGLVPLLHKIEVYVQINRKDRNFSRGTPAYPKISDGVYRRRSECKQIVRFKLGGVHDNPSATRPAASSLKHTFKAVLRVEGERRTKIGCYVRPNRHKADPFELGDKRFHQRGRRAELTKCRHCRDLLNLRVRENTAVQKIPCEPPSAGIINNSSNQTLTFDGILKSLGGKETQRIPFGIGECLNFRKKRC